MVGPVLHAGPAGLAHLTQSHSQQEGLHWTRFLAVVHTAAVVVAAAVHANEGQAQEEAVTAVMAECGRCCEACSALHVLRSASLLRV